MRGGGRWGAPIRRGRVRVRAQVSACRRHRDRPRRPPSRSPRDARAQGRFARGHVSHSGNATIVTRPPRVQRSSFPPPVRTGPASRGGGPASRPFFDNRISVTHHLKLDYHDTSPQTGLSCQIVLTLNNIITSPDALLFSCSRFVEQWKYPGSAQIVANKKPGLHPKRIPHKIPRSKKFEHWKRGNRFRADSSLTGTHRKNAACAYLVSAALWRDEFR